jgi:hypothetical protein
VRRELACDGDRDDRAALPTTLECLPAGVEAAGTLVGARADDEWLPVAAPLESRARAERSALVPGRFDQEPACVRVAGLGDPAQAASLAARVLAWR